MVANRESFHGTVLVATITSKTVDRAALKEWCEVQCGVKVAFVEFVQGTPKAWLRMASTEDAQKLLDTVKADERMKKTLGGHEASLTLLKGEEQEAYWQKITQAKKERAERMQPGTAPKKKHRVEDDGTLYKCSVCEEELNGPSFTISQLNRIIGTYKGQRSGKPITCKACLEKQEMAKPKVDPSKLTCVECGILFTSRNKLFAHIRAEGHDGTGKQVDVAAQQEEGGKRKADTSPAAGEPAAKAVKTEVVTGEAAPSSTRGIPGPPG